MKKFFEDIRNWAEKEENIDSVIIVGSYARGNLMKI